MMGESPRIPYLLWPLAFLLAFILAYAVNFIEKHWRRPKQRRPADWRAGAGDVACHPSRPITMGHSA